jgi:hypothetical protein
MSVKIMAQVWELDIDHSDLIVLLAMADHADDDGQNCYPSVGYLAWKSGYSDRQIRRVLRTLEFTGIITRVAHEEGGRGYATEYRIDPAKGDKKSAFTPDKRRTFTTVKADIHDTKADTGVHKGGHSYVPPTVINHQVTINEPFTPVETTGVHIAHNYPDWFQPLVDLKGFKNTAHKGAIESIQAGCDEAGVNEAEIVRAFADYYRDGGRAINGWSDPVAALVRTLPVQIAKKRKGGAQPARPKTDWVAMAAELEARRARG